jgi:prophage maintenance system killer protein
LKYDTGSYSNLTRDHPENIEVLTVEEAESIIEEMKQILFDRQEAAWDVFGIPYNDKGIKGILGNVYQSFDRHQLYPTAVEQAAQLLYFIIKDHPFVDVNKIIGCQLFCHVLEKNDLLEAKGNNHKFLAFLVAFIVISQPDQKESATKFITETIFTENK